MAVEKQTHCPMYFVGPNLLDDSLSIYGSNIRSTEHKQDRQYIDHHFRFPGLKILPVAQRRHGPGYQLTKSSKLVMSFPVTSGETPNFSSTAPRRLIHTVG